MSSNITIAKLNTLVTANAVQFVSEMNKSSNVAKRTATAVRGALASLGAGLSVAGIAAFSKSVIDLGGQIVDMSHMAGMSTQTFQTMANIAAESGVQMEQMAKASENLRAKLQDAREEGAGPLNDKLKQLNLSAAALQGLAPERQWEVFARHVATATDKQAALNIAAEFFGAKIGPKLREVLDRLNKDGFDKLANETSKIRFTDEQLATLDKAGDKLMNISKELKVIAATGFLKALDSGLASWGSVGGATANLASWIAMGPYEKMKREGTLSPQLPAEEFYFGNTGRGHVGSQSRWANDRAMRAAAQAADRDNPFKSMREENYQQKKVNDLLGEFFGGMDAESKQRVGGKRDFAVPEVNTDRLSKLGMLTGDNAKEQVKRQTGYLQEMVSEIKKLNGTLIRVASAAASYA